MNELNVAGVVVLYNPGPEVLDNIKSYSSLLQKCYLIDNSEKADESILDQFKQIENTELIRLNENKGVAFALNLAADKALKEGLDYLLTMDQDSSFGSGMLLKMVDFIDRNPEMKIGIVSPYHTAFGGEERNQSFADFEYADTVMTSGNLLNLKAYQSTGGFREDFFIDSVDHEYCLRLTKKGYKIIQMNRVSLEHQLGMASIHEFAGKKVVTSNHSPVRKYYAIRNRLFLKKIYQNQFPLFFRRETKEAWKEIFKIIFFEKKKMRKIYAMILGILDFYRGKMGKCPYDL